MITQEQVQAISRIAPDAQYNIVDGVLVWHSGEVSDEAIAENVAWLNNRVEAYPSLADQADMQYWDALNGTTTWVDAINAIKQEFPK